jgi:hypothetical protein
LDRNAEALQKDNSSTQRHQNEKAAVSQAESVVTKHCLGPQSSRILENRSQRRFPMRRWIAQFIAVMVLATGPLLAQTAEPHRRSNEVPVDHGPFTPEANSAFQGGGMILQGAPGAPAPRPEPTPPGQTPRNMVPPR